MIARESSQAREHRFRRTLDNWLRRLMANAKANGKRKNQGPMCITLEDLKAKWKQQKGRCYWTGRKLTTQRCPNQISLDRVDSGLGYIPGNVVLASWQVNQLKSNLSVKDFLALCGDVTKNTRRRKTMSL